MNAPASLLCPIDYSDASAGALRYASAIAEHFSARLIVLTVEDPLLTSAMDLGRGFTTHLRCPGRTWKTSSPRPLGATAAPERPRA